MGAFYDELKSEKEENNTLYKLRKALGEEDFKDFMKAMKDPSISARAIHAALAKRGINVVAASTLNSLRRTLNENI
jgi:PleD family two-component response regulator